MAKANTLALASFEDIFQSSTAVQFGNIETVQEIPLSELYPPEFHPFQVRDDEDMQRLTEKIKRDGVRIPGIVRPREDGGYELISGNRRKLACERLGKRTMPVIIRSMDDDEAAILMVDSNLEQRTTILPSELAWAYRVELEALNHRGIKVDGIDMGTLSVTIVAKRANTSKSQIFRYIRLTELVPDLIDMVDAKRIAFNPAVELSYLTRKEQAILLDCIAKHDATPSLCQAQQLRSSSKSGELTAEQIDNVLSKPKKNNSKLTLKESSIKGYFPESYSTGQMENVILQLLETWSKKQVSEN